jgi:DNA polymerase I
VFEGTKFNPRRWPAWLNRNRIRWPRLGRCRLDLSQNTFREVSVTHPEVRPVKELLATLSQLGVCKLAVGSNGRNRCPLRPFASKTGRNQPSTTQFIFGPAVWVRGLIKPSPGMAVAYVDYEQQEFGIAAALSGDTTMQDAYLSGDPYLTFAKQASAVPGDATKKTHGNEREKFKVCALGVQYGMGALSLAKRLDVNFTKAQEFLRLHKTTYPAYWRWSKRVGEQGRREGKLTAAFGWRLNVSRETNIRSVRNFPLQANAAEMLRLACIALTEAGVSICCPVHDALLIEAPVGEIEHAVATTQRAMRRASEAVLGGFPLRTEVKTIEYPDRYMDPRGRQMWQTVTEVLNERMANVA